MRCSAGGGGRRIIAETANCARGALGLDRHKCLLGLVRAGAGRRVEFAAVDDVVHRERAHVLERHVLVLEVEVLGAQALLHDGGERDLELHLQHVDHVGAPDAQPQVGRLEAVRADDADQDVRVRREQRVEQPRALRLRRHRLHRGPRHWPHARRVGKEHHRVGHLLHAAAALAPSVWELDDVKKGVLLQLFGASNKQLDAEAAAGNARKRGEMNVLLVGDPGTSKSQLLQYVHKVAPRGIYTSGKGSSAVGLTAYVTRDPETREFVLESGALVLSDRGVCCIDEFDKMSDGARPARAVLGLPSLLLAVPTRPPRPAPTAQAQSASLAAGARSILHEAMEQQTVSVAKAGIICSLNARTSVLASANPICSKYDPKRSVVDNINLAPTLLSRFDLIYLILDKPNERADAQLARHLVSLYQLDRELTAAGISQRTLMDYITLARQEARGPRARVGFPLPPSARRRLQQDFAAQPRAVARGCGRVLGGQSRAGDEYHQP